MEKSLETAQGPDDPMLASMREVQDFLFPGGEIAGERFASIGMFVGCLMANAPEYMVMVLGVATKAQANRYKGGASRGENEKVN